MAAKCTFWLALALLFYIYALYPATLRAVCALRRLRGRTRAETAPAHFAAEWPAVSLVIPAFNEAAHLPAKFRNLSELDYPRDRLEIIFVSDGSTDGTDRLAANPRVAGLRFHRIARRTGKPNALNTGVRAARSEILVFSDAATLFAADAVKKLARHFADPRVGVVSGRLAFAYTGDTLHTEGLYWRYESALRRMEATIGAATTASGAFYAVRRSCYRELPTDMILDDLLIPMTARKLGFAMVHDPEAQALEPVAATPTGDFTRRARLAAGGFRALGRLLRCATASPLLFWAFVSHKALRWLAPLFLLALAGTSVALASERPYRVVLAVQLGFYLWALAGMTFRRQLRGLRFALAGYFLVAMNAAQLVGLARALTGNQPVTWSRAN